MFEDLDFSKRLEPVTKDNLFIPIYMNDSSDYDKYRFKQFGYTSGSWNDYDKNYIFEAELKYGGYSDIKSTASFIFCNDLFRGLMLLSDFNKLILSGVDVSKPIRGKWKFVKRGNGIGLILHEILPMYS